MQLTVVIPTYNEVENLPNLVSVLFTLPIPDLKLLVVDDNSPDGTGALAESLGKKYPNRISVLHRPGKLGLGTAYITGFKTALADGADAVAQMDADFSHPPAKLVELLDVLPHCDVALGSRYIPGGSLDENWSFWRKALSGFGNYYARTILGLPIHDVTGGFRVWHRNVLDTMPLHRVRSNGYVFQVEMAYLASRLGFCFQEIPIYFADRRLGKSKMSFRIQAEAALRVWQLRRMYRDVRAR
ncbi:MAG TPA: polyprenol monophosphomannose synthase [Anaerolineaceae bacterium]|nr:polyprenol monophosphomannose synthase [Anaerolineaceae bacterium]